MDAGKNQKSLIYGITGLVLQVGGLFVAPVANEIDPATGPLFTMTAMLAGIALLIVGLGYYASAKGHSWVWGLVGMLSIIGLLILAALPDRNLVRINPQSTDMDPSKPVTVGGLVFRCLGCNYILNGSTASACPECGRTFNVHDPSTMRVNDALGRGVSNIDPAPWTARWSLICGIIGIITFCVPFFSIVAPICGISFGHMARCSTRGKMHLRGTAGLALAGLIVSYTALALSLAMTAFMIVSLATQ